MATKIINTYSCPIKLHELNHVDDKLKYCESCLKKIHDLRNCDVNEITGVLSTNNGEICAIIDKRLLSNTSLNQITLLVGLSLSASLVVACTDESAFYKTNLNQIRILQDTSSQFIQIKGKMKDNSNGELLPFVSIAVLDINGKLIHTATTDLDGNYLINIDSKYKYEPLVFRCTYVGYIPVEIRNIKLSEIIEKISKVEISTNMEAQETYITVGLIIEEKPFVKEQTRPSERTYSRDEYLRMPK